MKPERQCDKCKSLIEQVICERVCVCVFCNGENSNNNNNNNDQILFEIWDETIESMQNLKVHWNVYHLIVSYMLYSCCINSLV